MPEPRHASPDAKAPARRTRLCAALAAVAVAAAAVAGIALWEASRSQADVGDALQAAAAPEAGEAADVEDVDDAAPEEPAVAHVTGTTASGISYEGSSAIEGSDALAELEDVVALYQGRGLTLSIAMYDLESDAWLTYQPDSRVYSASAIKGPYCIFLCSQLVDAGRVGASIMPTVQNCIQNSDNDAYRTIRSSTMNMGWSGWLEGAGVPMEEGRAYRFDNRWYADMCASDLVACWRAAYDYLSSGEGQSATLASYFERTVHSPLHDVLGGGLRVWSKAGWYSGAEEEGASAATNDAGIVFADSGTYVVAVMSNAPADFEPLEQAVDAVNRCHGALTGGSEASLLAATDDAAA